MNKNRKIVALICAMSMIFSLFTAFTVVNVGAEEVTKGIVLEYDKDNSTATKAVVVAKYVGAESADGYTIRLNVPENYESIEYKNAFTGWFESPTQPTADNLVYGLSCAGSALATSENNVLATITINLKSELPADFEMSLQSGSTVSLTDGELKLNNNTLPVASVTVPTDPSATPKPTANPRPSMVPVPSADPSKPVMTPVPVTKGITLELDSENSTDTKKVIIAKYVGAESVDGYTIRINVPANYESIEYKSAFTGWFESPTQPTADNLVYGLSCAGSALATSENNVLVTITINLKSALTEDYNAQLQSGSTVSLTDGELKLNNNTLPAAWVNVPAGDTDTPTVKKEIKLSDILDADKAAAAEKDENSVLYVTVQVDPANAVYGRDYVAVYNGKELSEAEYYNLIWGYTTDKMSDIIKGLTFKVYSGTDVQVKSISAQLNDEFTGLQIDEGTAKVDGKNDPTPNPGKAAIKVVGRVAGKDSDTKTVTVGKNITLTATVTLPSDAKEITEGKAWSYDIDRDNADTYVEELKAEVSADDAHEYVVKFETLKTISKLPVVFSYKYIDKNGDEATATATANVQIVKESTSGNGGSGNGSSGNGSGSIAYGSQNANQNTGAINFQDIDTVPWAQDAILALVQRGVINGRSNTIFDPNGTVTRAEFAKMVVLGFQLAGSAPGSFSDVDYTEWYGRYVQTAYANDVISGYDDGTFRPNGLITRQEMAAMISRAIKAANKTLPATVAAAAFTDVTDADWGKAEITALQQGGVINGMTETTYEPQSNATRAQAAVIIYRAITKAQ